MVGLEPTLFAVDAHVLRVVERAAAFLHRVVEHVVDRLDEPRARRAERPPRLTSGLMRPRGLGMLRAVRSRPYAAGE